MTASLQYGVFAGLGTLFWIVALVGLSGAELRKEWKHWITPLVLAWPTLLGVDFAFDLNLAEWGALYFCALAGYASYVCARGPHRR